MLVASTACSEQAEPRAQVLFVVDTDLPVASQVAGDAELSADATIDTLRVDVLGASGDVSESQLFVLPSPEEWPVSFGVVSEAGTVRARLRLFRSAVAASGLQNGVATLEPPPRTSVDRLVDVATPADGVKRARVVLRGDCLGIPALFGSSPVTCIDAERPNGDPGDGLDEPVAATELGTWAHARSKPCAGAGGDDRICIRGGFSVMGDPKLYGVSDGSDVIDAAPPHPVILSPFWMDRTEVSVGRLRALAQSGSFGAALPTPASEDPDCTWLGPNDPANDALPVNCIRLASARAACQAAGGDLPSEAQFEHASRGRGQRRFFPWGETVGTCCTATLSRKAPGQIGNECEGPMLDPVGSHLPSPACGGLGDESRDGVLDLGGNVSEYVLDAPLPYTDPCWTAPGVPKDPVCSADPKQGIAARGGFGIGGFGQASGASRAKGTSLGARMEGFRCVYAD